MTLKLIVSVLRFVIGAAVTVTFVNALVFFGLGIYVSVENYWHMIQGHAELHRPGIAMLESIDRFFIGFIFLIMATGLTKLFLPGSFFLKNVELPGLEISNFYQLKMLLWSTILTALFVVWVTHIVGKGESFAWVDLVLPAGIAILAIASKFIKEIH